MSGRKPNSLRCDDVLVACRVRPVLPHESRAKRLSIDYDASAIHVARATRMAQSKTFFFDRVFDAESTQADVYRGVCAGLVEHALQGINACSIAYGPTGAGKTFTTFGPDVNSARVTTEDASQLGLLPRAMHELFEKIAMRSSDYDFCVTVGYVQAYMGHVQDLLRPGTGVHRRAAPSLSSAIRLRETDVGLWMEGLTWHRVHNVHEVLRLLEEGAAAKATTATSLNANSSRAHTLFCVDIERTIKVGSRGMERGASSGVNSTGIHAEEDEFATHLSVEAAEFDDVVTSKLTFVDLAGSERVAKSKATGLALREAKHINKSLSALGNVMAALSEAAAQRFAPHGSSGGHFIPWRESALTRLLHERLRDRCVLSFLANVAPADEVLQEGIAVLTFATRVKRIMTIKQIPLHDNDWRRQAEQLQQELDSLKDFHRQRISVMIQQYDAVMDTNQQLIHAVAALQSENEALKRAAQVQALQRPQQPHRSLDNSSSSPIRAAELSPDRSRYHPHVPSNCRGQLQQMRSQGGKSVVFADEQSFVAATSKSPAQPYGERPVVAARDQEVETFVQSVNMRLQDLQQSVTQLSMRWPPTATDTGARLRQTTAAPERHSNITQGSLTPSPQRYVPPTTPPPRQPVVSSSQAASDSPDTTPTRTTARTTELQQVLDAHGLTLSDLADSTHIATLNQHESAKTLHPSSAPTDTRESIASANQARQLDPGNDSATTMRSGYDRGTTAALAQAVENTQAALRRAMSVVADAWQDDEAFSDSDGNEG